MKRWRALLPVANTHPTHTHAYQAAKECLVPCVCSSSPSPALQDCPAQGFPRRSFASWRVRGRTRRWDPRLTKSTTTHVRVIVFMSGWTQCAPTLKPLAAVQCSRGTFEPPRHYPSQSRTHVSRWNTPDVPFRSGSF